VTIRGRKAVGVANFAGLVVLLWYGVSVGAPFTTYFESHSVSLGTGAASSLDSDFGANAHSTPTLFKEVRKTTEAFSGSFTRVKDGGYDQVVRSSALRAKPFMYTGIVSASKSSRMRFHLKLCPARSDNEPPPV
jgi:hypothetical protein